MRITSLAWGALLSLVLILIPIVIVVHRDKPHGLPLLIAYDDRRHEEICEDGRIIIVRVLANGNVSFNGGELEIPRSELANRLQDVFRTRAERVIFVEAEPDLPISAVAEVIDISRSQVNLVVIVTPAVEAGHCLSIYRNPQGVL